VGNLYFLLDTISWYRKLSISNLC